MRRETTFPPNALRFAVQSRLQDGEEAGADRTEADGAEAAHGCS